MRLNPLFLSIPLLLASAAPALAAAPCAGATWGLISDPAHSIHVAVTGSDTTGDGSESSPYATLAKAHAESREAGVIKKIALHPGAFDGGLVLLKDGPGTSTDDGLSIEGCSAGEVTVKAPAGGSGDPVVEIDAADSVLVEGMTLDKGRRTLEVHSGATADISLAAVTGGKRQGIFVDGTTTEVRLVDVDVSGTLTDGGAYGWGIAVQGGQLTMLRGGVSGGTEFGIFADQAALVDLDSVDVADVLANSAGTYGRGIQLQGGTDASVLDGSVTGCVDAGLFASRVASLVIDGIHVDEPTQGVIPGSSETTGDGIVISRAGSAANPSQFVADLDNIAVDLADRGGIVLDGVTATVDGNSGTGNGGPTPPKWSAPALIYFQDSAAVSGADVAETELVCDLVELGMSELGLNLAEVEADRL